MLEAIVPKPQIGEFQVLSVSDRVMYSGSDEK